MVETTFIYALKDPETGNCRYVGKSDNPKGRFSYHLHVKDRKPNHRTNWIAHLAAHGKRPVLEILDEVPKAQWQFWEREYIRIFRAIGFDLVNTTEGGEGQEGRKATPETCAKQRIKRRDATSKFHGVSWHTKRRRWRSVINFARKETHIGYFLTEIEAANAYDGAARNLCGAHAVLNFP